MSGVTSTAKMIEDWRQRYCDMYAQGTPHPQFLANQSWFKSGDEYSVLFESLYDQPSQRREFIESCVKDATPSWGYIYLVNLLAHGVFNTVFTTNFDDLLNEACYLFSNRVRPIVCAHDSSIRALRITAHRPKIIKLHGDFLFDNIKNTINELESLENNMREKFRQFSQEFGLIVVGYAGNDRSIMDTLNSLLRSEMNFPHGVYWCVRSGSPVSKNVEVLTRYPRFKLIEISGFDEFFAEVQEALGLPLQPEMSDPYGALVKRLNSLLADARVPDRPTHPVIDRDIKAIGQKIALLSDTQGPASVAAGQGPDYTLKVGDTVLKLPIPYDLLSQIKRRDGSFREALSYLMEELKVRPASKRFLEAFMLMTSHSLFEFEESLLDLLRGAKDVLIQRPMNTFDMALPLISAGRFDAARVVLDIGFEIHQRSPDVPYAEDLYSLNKLQIKAHASHEYSPADVEQLNRISDSGNFLAQMGALILLKQYEKAELALHKAINAKEIVDLQNTKEWPIMRLLIPHLKDKSVFESPPASATRAKQIKSTIVHTSDENTDSALSVKPSVTPAIPSAN